MKYTPKEHKRNILNGIASSLVAGVFFGVLYDTKSWMISIFVTLLYSIGAYWFTWFLVKDRSNKN